MAQGDMNIANQGFPSFRADLNDQLQALVTNSSGATAPSTTFPHQWWLDTSTTPNTLRQRNLANDAWIVVGLFDQSSNTFNVPVAQGGTGAATASNARTNLGALAAQNPSYTGTLTGGTGVVNLGSGQFTKDANGLVIIQGGIAGRVLSVRGGLGMEVNEDSALTKVLTLRSDFAGVGPAVNVTTNDPLLFCTNNVIRAQIASNGAQSSVIPGGVTLYPEFKCRAWVNFDGTTTPPTIRASGNVSSVTRNGTGDYTVNFTTAMPDANYAVSGTNAFLASNASLYAIKPHTSGSFTTSSVRINSVFADGGTNALWNANTITVEIFR